MAPYPPELLPKQPRRPFPPQPDPGEHGDEREAGPDDPAVPRQQALYPEIGHERLNGSGSGIP